MDSGGWGKVPGKESHSAGVALFHSSAPDKEKAMSKRFQGVSFWVTLACAALLGAALAPMGGTAQTFRGTILGTVTDVSGAVMAGAKVTVRNTQTGLMRTTVTSADGSYAVPELPIGTYAVTVENKGFQTSVTTGVRVDVAAERRVDIVLKPGAVSQRVEVSAESLPPVDTTTDVLGGTFESSQVTALPINGRDYTKLLIMVPGAVGEPNGGGDSPGSFGLFSVNGSRGRSNNYLLDGTDMNDGYRNLPAINQGGVFGTPGTILPEDAIAELRVLSNYEAEFGRNSGSVVNIVTKSGTNDLHGSIFEYFRNDHLNARNFFNSDQFPKDRFRNNQFGASLGGPIVKNKTFFYGSYEGQREGMSISNLNTVPTLSDVASAVSALGGTAPCTTTIFDCITANSSVINPVTLNFYNLCHRSGKCSGGRDIWPAANVVIPGNVLNSVAPAPASNDLDSFLVKIDHSLNAKNQLSGRYFFGNSNQSFPLGLGGGNNLPGTNTVSPIRTQLVSISWVGSFSTSKVNEFRFGWNRYRNGFFPADATIFGNPNSSLGLNNGVTNPRDFGLPTIKVSGLSSLGSSQFSNPRDRVDTNWQFIDNFSWKLARHDIKFGYEFRRTAVDSFNDINERGTINFGGLQDFLAGNVGGGVLTVGDTSRKAHQNSHALYIQDSYRLTRNFLMNLGVRWDYFGVIGEDQNRFSIYDPAVGLVHRDPLYDREWHDFSPRVSFAWDVTGKGKTVLRSGFGMFYDIASQDFFTGQIPFNTFNTGPAYNAIGPNPIFIDFGVVNSPLQAGEPVFVPSAVSPGPGNATTDAFTVARHLPTPYVYNYNLNLQQELFRNTVLEVGYVGSAGRHLFRFRDINQPSDAAIKAYDYQANGCCVPRPFDSAAVLSSLAPNAPFYVNQVETAATSNYNSLQVSLTQRNWHGWSHQIAYTWSHSIDTASDGQDYVPNASQPNDSTNANGNKGPSNFDVRQRFVWSLEYELPKWSALGRMGEGWAISSVLTLMSGHPFHLNYNFEDDFDGSGEFFGRPDVVGPVRYNRSNPFQFLDLSSFAVPCTFDGLGTAATDCVFSPTTGNSMHFGNLGRNALLGPDYRNFDLAVMKTTSLSERFKLLLRADFYNLTNHPNFASPLLPSFIADAAFNGIDPATGRSLGFLPITQTSDVGLGNPFLGGGGPRSIQLGLKLMF
jgi:Carboxypeptidase regulatory-like domain/TonB dependent receptor-like, beta-barrel